MEGSERGGNTWKRDDPQSRYKSWPKDYSNVEYYYCHEKGHLKYNCSKIKEELKNLKQLQGKLGKMKVDDEGGSFNVVCDDYDSELLLTQDEDVSQ